MHTEAIAYDVAGTRYLGYLAFDPARAGKRPGVLVCHEGPGLTEHRRAGFEKEMQAAGIDWRLQLYGGAGHSFTNSTADSRGMKGFFYHEATDRRSWHAMIELFDETLK